MGARIGPGTGGFESPEAKRVSNTEYSTTPTAAPSTPVAEGRDTDGVQARKSGAQELSLHSPGPMVANDALLRPVSNQGASNSKPQEQYELLRYLSATLEKHPAAMEPFLDSSVGAFH